ncbi:MAG: hypothetical protein AAGN35_20195 [Bacteroidota bacterium]
MNFLPSFLLALALVFAAGCGNDPQKNPTATATAFLEALQFGDYEKAKGLCSPGTQDNLGMFQLASGLGNNPFSEDFKILREEISSDGGYAKVFYVQGDESQEKYVRLRNNDKQWEVLANKTDLSLDDDEDTGGLLDSDKDVTDIDHSRAQRTLREGKSARQIAEGFLTAMMFGDYEKAKRFASKSSGSAIDMQSGIGRSSLEDFEVDRVEENDEFATAYYTEKGETAQKELKMSRDELGNWQVIMSKNDDNGSDTDFDFDLEDEAEEQTHAEANERLRAGKTPKQIATNFLDAMSRRDFTTAKRYASKSSETAIDMQDNSGNSSINGFEIIRSRTTGDEARVTYIERDQSREQELKLKKDPLGNWQVIMSKDN